MIWLTTALVYCLVCWGIGYASLQWVARPSDEDAPDDIPLSRYSWLAIILITPLVVPFIACTTTICVLKSLAAVGTLRRINRTVREYEFVRVNVLHLEEWIRQHFETLTGPLIRLGFDLIGDFRMKPEPVEVHDRVFISAAGDVIADICALLGEGNVSFISVLEDGTCVQTTSVDNPHPDRTIEPADQLHLTYLPDVPMDEAHRRHLDTLGELAARNGTGVLRFSRDQFRAVFVYDQRMFNRWRYRHGGFDREPPAPDIQTLLASPVPVAHAEGVLP